MTEETQVVKKPRGRPAKVPQVPTLNAGTPELTLKEALAKGLVVESSTVNELIFQALNDERKRLKKQVATEYAKEQAKERGNPNKAQIEAYAQQSQLTNLEFIKELMHLNIRSDQAKALRDDHFNLKNRDGKLDRNRIWQIVREHFN